MNKIIIADDIIKEEVEDSIKNKKSDANPFFNVKTLNIKICNNTDLEIEYTSTGEIKLEIYINVLPNVKAEIYEIKENGNYKLQYKYYLEESSELKVFKFNNASMLREMSVINLNGKYSSFTQNLRTVSHEKNKYDVMIYHNATNSNSLIDNKGINILEGKTTFNVSSFVPNKVKGCTLKQKNHIINLTNNKCIIKPNLFIDEDDVSASHGALVGTFSKEELFYLQSRGLTKDEAEKLLVKGILLKDMPKYHDKIEKTINSYWG